MSEQGYVFGCILGAGAQHIMKLDFVMHHNLAVIAKLPPLISFRERILVSASIFKMPVIDPQDHNTYRIQMIPFGMSINHLQTDLGDWIIQFEALLRQLYWREAYMYARAELYLQHTQYHWEAIFPQAEKDPPEPVQDWIFEGGARSFK